MNQPTPATSQGASQAARLSQEQTLEVFEHLKYSNSLELKVMVPEATLRGTIDSLGFDMVAAEPRTTYFFDTPDLRLNKAGVIVRARRRPGDRADTVVKLRPVDPARLDSKMRKDPDFKIEVDVMPGGYVCSASAKGRSTSQQVLDAAADLIPLRKLYSRKQRDFFAEHAPPGIELDKLVPLGPTFLLCAKQVPRGFDRAMTVELWFYPNGTRTFEISTKGAPDEAFQLGAQFKAFLSQCGIEVDTLGATKTSSALTFFSKKFST